MKVPVSFRLTGLVSTLNMLCCKRTT